MAGEIPRARIEQEVRTRLAERLASAGVPSSQIALQVLFLMPPDFVDAYQSLFLKALKVGDEGVRDAEVGRETEGKRGGRVPTAPVKASGARRSAMSEGKTLGEMAGASGTGKRYRRAWTIADERALARKSEVDKRLRRMAKRIADGMMADLGEMEAESEGARRCTNKRCGKFLSELWAFCPNCGARVRKSS